MKLLQKNTSRNLKSKRMMSLFECPRCGNKVERRTSDGLKQKRCCGGISQYAPKGSKLHNTYIGMTQRCWDKNAINYSNYGGRGITVCKEWRNFDNFALWALINGFKEGLEIDRIDNYLGYEPTNCRFVTRSENMRNTRVNIHTIEEIREIRAKYSTRKYTQKQLAIEYNDSEGNINNIIKHRSWKEVE